MHENYKDWLAEFKANCKNVASFINSYVMLEKDYMLSVKGLLEEMEERRNSY